MKSLDAKAVVLGSQAVGKTSIVMRCVRDMFDAKQGPTIGAAFFTYKMTINGYRVNLQIWDTAGQERFKSMAPMYYRKASIAILVYDITDADSFTALKGWVFELKRNVDRNVCLMLFGNKCDLEEKRQVQVKEASDYAESIGARYVEVSALTGEGIHDGFTQIGEMVIEALEARLPTYAQLNSSSGRVSVSSDASDNELTDLHSSGAPSRCSC